MLNAEELGVSSTAIDSVLKFRQSEVRQLVGLDGSCGSEIGHQ
jgi:hypothetical protein